MLGALRVAGGGHHSIVCPCSRRQREGYRAFAAAGSKLFFILRALKNLDHMFVLVHQRARA